MAQDRLDREQDAFLERHIKTADLLVFDTRRGHCTEALYYSPMKKAHDDMSAHLREFFRQVRESENDLVGERYDDMPNNPGADLE